MADLNNVHKTPGTKVNPGTELVTTNVPKADKKATQEENKAETPLYSQISVKGFDKGYHYFKKAGYSRDTFEKLFDRNTSQKEMEDILINVKGSLSEQERDRFSRIIAKIAISTGSEKLLAANLVSDIKLAQHKFIPNASVKLLDELSEHPVSKDNPDYQKNLFRMMDAYKDLQNRFPAVSETLTGIAAAIAVVSEALRNYYKEEKKAQAKEEEAREKAQKEQREKKQQQEEEKGIVRAMREVYPSSNDAPEIREALKICAANLLSETPTTNRFRNMAIDMVAKKEREERARKASLKEDESPDIRARTEPRKKKAPKKAERSNVPA